MTNPKPPHEDSDGNDPPGKPKADPAKLAEFTHAVEAFAQAMGANQAEQAEAAVLHMLSLAAEEAERNPTPELLLAEEANECEARGDWAAAETAYRKIVEMEAASRENDHARFGHIFKAHRDLSHLFTLQSRYEKAGESAQAATVAARRADLRPLLIRALENEAYCLLRLGDGARALAAASEAVRVVEPGPLSDHLHASVLACRARCHVALGDVEAAEGDLEACRPLLFDRAVSPLFAGVNASVCAWWSVRANLCELRGDWPGAVEAWQKALEVRRHLARLPHVAGPHTLAALARTLLRLGEALRKSGQLSEAESALTEGANAWCELGLAPQKSL